MKKLLFALPVLALMLACEPENNSGGNNKEQGEEVSEPKE